MNVRTVNGSFRIEWKEKSRDRWIGRTLSVSRKNLQRHGVQPPGPGKPVREWHAQRLLAAVQRSLGEASEPDRNRVVLLTEMIDVFLDELRCTEKSRQKREQVLRRPAIDSPCAHPKLRDISLLTFLGDLPLTEIESEDLVKYRNFLADAGYSSMSVRDYVVIVRTLFSFGVRHGYLDKNPASEVRLPPSEPSEEIRILTKGQVGQLLALAGDPLQYDPIRHKNLDRSPYGRRQFLPTPGNSVLSQVLPGFVYLGLRRSELVRLLWEDIDLKRRVVLVRGARKNPAKRERRRAVPIPGALCEFLRRKPRTSPYAFTNSNGEQWNVHSLSCALRRFRKTYRERLGFDFDFQTLRRTYGSLLYQEGYSLDQVAEFLGHSESKTTRKWYAGLRAEDHHDRVTRVLSFQQAACGTEKRA